MSLNSVSGKTFFEKINPKYNQNKWSQGSAYNNFAENLKEKTGQESDENLHERVSESRTATQIDYRSGKVATELLLQKTGRVEMHAVMETSVRHISYSESDQVRICVEEGYTLKAKVEMDEHRVYIEQKNEDGTYLAYEVNPLEVSEDTTDSVEQLAVETWEMARELLNGGMFTPLDKNMPDAEQSAVEEETAGEETEPITFSEMLKQFEEFVEKRIKEGPPKIQIGGAEFTEEEWERLLKKIDKDIDAYKEELRERLRRRQEQEALNSAAGSVEEELGAESVSEEEVNVTEREALEVSQSEKVRGSSFKERLSGVKKAPYSYLADENGIISYNGVTFVCNDEKQQICLGDMSDTKNVINIPLAEGGCLRVNRDNIGDLAKAIGMFSPEDMGRIMRAIAQDNKVREMELEIDEMTM